MTFKTVANACAKNLGAELDPTDLGSCRLVLRHSPSRQLPKPKPPMSVTVLTPDPVVGRIVRTRVKYEANLPDPNDVHVEVRTESRFVAVVGYDTLPRPPHTFAVTCVLARRPPPSQS